MARGRFLSDSVAKDKRLNDLSLESELVYLMTIPHLDRDGLIEGDPDVLWGAVCPKRRALLSVMPDLIDEWVNAGLVLRYDTDDGSVLWFMGFAKNQQGLRYERETPSKFPPPPGYFRNGGGLAPQDEEPPFAPSAEEIPPTPAILRQSSDNCSAQGQGQVQDQVKDQDQAAAAARAHEVEPEPAAVAAEKATAAVWQCWNENMPGAVTQVISDGVNAAIDDYGPNDVIRAIGIAVKRNRRTLGYVQGILAKGVDSSPPAKPPSGVSSNGGIDKEAILAARKRLEAEAQRTAAKYGSMGNHRTRMAS